MPNIRIKKKATQYVAHCKVGLKILRGAVTAVEFVCVVIERVRSIWLLFRLSISTPFNV
jgi:hypothetical protein